MSVLAYARMNNRDYSTEEFQCALQREGCTLAAFDAFQLFWC